ncbi:Glyoxalase/fosfomycin resistance/dioxygenase domain containing protein [Trema orientale]|uniref:Glyoxalase/fosfomycin resistance/dioxygenase domain containing protein n=1 Tax=Trema orientale TaxID=63057 RepID=A0A2P5EFY9_TREOI|nr:Glyoxalase/fosfomycin resistance/dioxygenase domain containing protein [Trema orientale]
MASLLSPSPSTLLQPKAHRTSLKNLSSNPPSKLYHQTSLRNVRGDGLCFVTKAKLAVEGDVIERQSLKVDHNNDYGVVSIHHVGLLCENLERSLNFYQNILGLEINEARPHDKLPYRGAWLWVGSEMIHLMELPNPDPLTGRPAHGGRDRHTCIAIRDVSKLKAIFDEAGIAYTLSKSGRPAIFARDPDANALEFTQVDN